jgi:hypothetical protein
LLGASAYGYQQLAHYIRLLVRLRPSAPEKPNHQVDLVSTLLKANAQRVDFVAQLFPRNTSLSQTILYKTQCLSASVVNKKPLW